jgi:phosphinothricin acetyltransferase
MIRSVKSTDADALARIYNHYIQNTVVTFEEATLSGASMALRINGIETFGLPWLVAERGGKIIGYAYATRWKERSAYRHTVEVSAYLSSSLLSKGWGTKLYEALFAALRQSAVHIVIAGIALPNDASVALHEKFGMKKVAHFEEVGFKQGRRVDVGYWQVCLNA